MSQLYYLQQNFHSLSEILDYRYFQSTKYYENYFNQTNKPVHQIMIYLLDELEQIQKQPNKQQNFHKDSLLSLYYLCLQYNEEKQYFTLNNENLIQLFKFNGIYLITKYTHRLLISFEKENNTTDSLSEQEQQEIQLNKEISLKTCLNILYLLMNFIVDQQSEQEKQNHIQQYHTSKLEEMLLKGIQLSIELSMIPIKKFIILYYCYIENYLQWDPLYLEYQKKNENNKSKSDNIYTEKNIEFISRGPRRANLTVKKDKINNAEIYYKKHIMNTTENPLAQIVTVGMLRTLLTTCATNNKYQPSSKGVDLNREWESSILHYIQQKISEKEQYSEQEKNIIEDYQKYIVNSDFCQPNKEVKKGQKISILKVELDRHRLTTSCAISSMFLILLKHFQRNSVWQFSYLIQLLTDANGVLVFLKFLTEKFTSIPKDFNPLNNLDDNGQDFTKFIKFTIYQILKLMFITCNNFPDKIKKYLLEYNAVSILRKLPQLLKCEKIEHYCDKLLRIQFNFFNKKMRSIPNNMKMITEAFCKNVKSNQQQPLPTDDYDVIKPFYLYERIKDRRKVPLYNQLFNNSEAVSKINQDFNNYHYYETQQEQEEENEENNEQKRSDQKQQNKDDNEKENDYIIEEQNNKNKNNLKNRNNMNQNNSIKENIEKRMNKQIDMELQTKNEEQIYGEGGYQKWMENNLWGYYD